MRLENTFTPGKAVHTVWRPHAPVTLRSTQRTTYPARSHQFSHGRPHSVPGQPRVPHLTAVFPGRTGPRSPTALHAFGPGERWLVNLKNVLQSGFVWCSFLPMRSELRVVASLQQQGCRVLLGAPSVPRALLFVPCPPNSSRMRGGEQPGSCCFPPAPTVCCPV